MVRSPARSKRTQAPARRRLPPPETRGDRPFEDVLRARRSHRRFDGRPLSEQQISQLLWAGQGVTSRDGLRTAPSAGRAYPVELYVATPSALLHYIPRGHAVEEIVQADVREDLMIAGLGQPAIVSASAVFVISVITARTEREFGTRASRYVLLEAGHVAQNILLQATAMGLAAVPMGNVDDISVHRVAQVASRDLPVYLVAVGRPV